jgi:Family of unknown function (DUF5675)
MLKFMKEVYLFRNCYKDSGTEGTLITNGFQCRTLELPWKDNHSNLSCIPVGEYIVEIYNSPKFGNIYHVTNVNNRQFILMHPGNWAGDKTKGLRTDVEGCILLGLDYGILDNQRALINSKKTVQNFMTFMNNETFKLIIKGEN